MYLLQWISALCPGAIWSPPGLEPKTCCSWAAHSTNTHCNECIAQWYRCQLGCSGSPNLPCISRFCYRSILSEIIFFFQHLLRNDIHRNILWILEQIHKSFEIGVWKSQKPIFPLVALIRARKGKYFWISQDKIDHLRLVWPCLILSNF